MRTKFLILLSVIVSLSLITAPSNAAVKAGAKCTKAGATATAAGKKFTCVKSGKKLVWSKGVSVKAAPKPTLSPVFKPTTPTSAPTPTTSSTSPNPIDNQTCTKKDEEVTTSNGMFKCQQRSDGQLFWSKNNPPPVIDQSCPRLNEEILTSNGILKCEQRSDGKLAWTGNNLTSTPSTPTTASEIQLPIEGTACPVVGGKISNSKGTMRCYWAGHANTADEAKQRLIWRKFEVPKISTSQSNNYSTTPVESAECANSGDTFDVPGGKLECRWVSGKKLQWIKVNTVKKTFINAKSPVSIDTCKLQMSASKADRTGRNAGGGMVGFPLIDSEKNGMKAKGTNEVLIVPIDFPDFPGGSGLKEQLAYDKKWLVEWYEYFSGGQSKFNVTTIDRWVTMPLPRSGYPTNEKSIGAEAADSVARQATQAQPFMDVISKEIDLRKFSTVFLFSPDAEYELDAFVIRNYPFKIKEGVQRFNLFSFGRNNEGMETLKWSYYVHENLHDFNIIGHAPGNGWPLGMMTNQSGISYAMNPWEQFVLDWLPSDQIYCDDVATLKTTTISLSPLEREDRQTKMAVIKLSATKAIVIESHGIDKWSSFNFGDRSFPPGFYSVMTYIVDLDKQAAAPINSDGGSQSNDDWSWAVWQKVSGSPSNQFNVNVGDRKNLADYVAVLGDSFVIEGVRIKFVGTGDYETIEISKA